MVDIDFRITKVPRTVEKIGEPTHEFRCDLKVYGQPTHHGLGLRKSSAIINAGLAMERWELDQAKRKQS